MNRNGPLELCCLASFGSKIFDFRWIAVDTLARVPEILSCQKLRQPPTRHHGTGNPEITRHRLTPTLL
jgi:hypothetical protein